ncbi:Low-temperature-induced 65 kDa protein [Hirschfeldia incana]|nr:Low-temperature-induced 65 kDa protein [Hirschfeldia incana]
MDMQSQMTRPYGHDQAEDPIRIHHPEEEEHHEKGATKVLKKVKEKAKKIKNSLTKHGHDEHDHDVDEEDYEYDEPDPEVHGAPVYESFAVRGGVTGHPETLSHPGETNLPAPEEIIPPGTKVFPVVTTDHTKPVEPEPLQDTSYGHEAPPFASFHPLTDISEKEERREATSHPLKVFDMSEREESREDHQMPMHTPPPASLLSSTEDVTRTFAPGDDDEGLGGQRRVNIGRPRGLEEDPAAPGVGGSSISNYQTKVTDPTHQGGGEAGVPAIVESLGKMRVSDEAPVHRSGRDFEREIPTRSHEFGLKDESGIGKDSPAGFGGESGAGIGKGFPTGSHEFGREEDSGTDKNSQTVLTSGSIAGLGEEIPARSHESGVKDTAKGYGEETGPGLEKHLPARNDDVKVETLLSERDLPTGTHDQFSPELSRPIEKETHESKPTSYTEKIGTATSYVTDKAVAAKNAVASKLGYSGESGGGGVQQQSHVGDETTPRSATGYGQSVAGTVAEKLTPVYEKVKETGSSVITKLPLSGGGSGAEDKQHVEEKGASTRDYLAEKLRPGEEDRALSEVIAEKLHLGGGGDKKRTTIKEMEVTVEKIPTDKILEEKEHGESITDEGKVVGGGGGMVGKVRGAVTSWLGGTAEDVKTKSSESVDDKSSQSLGSTVGTTGFSDSGGALPGQRGL